MRLSLKLVTLPLIFLVVILTSGTGYAVRLKIATLSPDGSMWMEKMRQGAAEVAEKTGNRVTFKFYPGGVMGNDKAVLRKIRIGQLHGGAVVSGSLSSFFPASQVYAQPFKFTTIKEVDYVRKHIDSYVINGFNDSGFVVFGLIGGGFAYIMSQVPVETIDDLIRQKVWIPDNDRISQEWIKTFGISPIPLPISDVRTGLQSGLINTVATSPIGAVILQWHTQVKYVTNLPLVYLYGVLAVDKKKFSKIAPKDQETVIQVMGSISRTIDSENRKDNISAINTLKKRGLTFITPSDNAQQEWKKIGRNASSKMVASGDLPEDIVKQIDSHLVVFHENKPASGSQ